MFSVVALIIIAAVLLPVLFTLGSVVQYFTEDVESGNLSSTEDTERGYDAGPEPEPRHQTQTSEPMRPDPRYPSQESRNPPPQTWQPIEASPRYAPETRQPIETAPPQNPPQNQPQNPPQPHYHGGQENGKHGGGNTTQYPNTQQTGRRAPTPVQNNHYRSTNFPRPATPVTGSNASDSRLQRTGTDTTTPSNTVTGDQDRLFRKFAELSADEKRGIVDVGQYFIDVRRVTLEPVLRSIDRTGGPSVPFVVAYFNKKNDKQLSPYEKRVRKSYKIRNQRLGLSRYARLAVHSISPDYYRLKFFDYTPYVEDHSPKFDVNRMDFSKERSRWETIDDVSLHHNTETLNVRSLSILVPGK